MGTGLTLLIAFGAFACLAVLKGGDILREYRAFKAWQRLQQTLPETAPPAVQPTMPVPMAPVNMAALPTAMVPNAARALAQPPESLMYSIAYICERYEPGRFSFPIGWWLNYKNEPSLVVGHLVNDINCGLITAIQGGGKDNAVLNMLLTLMATNDPAKLQVVIIDGKGGLDYIGWDEKAHVWHIAKDAHELPHIMDLLTAERMRRVRTLRQAGVSKWENYKGQDMPMLVVLFSEIKMLQRVMPRKEIETYLDSELSVWRGLGMRMLVCTQNSSNWSKEWRGAFEFFIAGTQPSRDEDKPNTGKDPKDLEAMGVIPPSKLPSVGEAPGVMTVVHGTAGVTVRTSYISDEQRAWWLNHLPSTDAALAQRRQREKAALLRDLMLFRATVEAAAEGKPVIAPATDAPVAPSMDWRDWPMEPGPNVDEPQPVIALAQTEQPATPSYDRQELAQVLAGIKLKDLPAHPVFVAACKAAYQKRQSYMGVAKEFWGSSSGSRETAIKAALGHAEVGRGELQPAA